MFIASWLLGPGLEKKKGKGPSLASYIFDIRTWVIGLIFGCPFNEPLSNCPVNDIRQLPPAERIGIVDRMSVENIERIISHHKKCFKMREG